MESEHSKSITVLLVEDSVPAQKIAASLLSNLGYQVDVAATGEEAIKLFRPNKYIFVLLDLGLSDMKGYQVAEYFRNLERTTAPAIHMPILALSVHADKEHKQAASAAGIDDIEQKPISVEKINLFLRQHVEY